MIQYFSADYIFPIHEEAIKDGIVAIDEKNTIVGLYKPAEEVIKDKKIQKHKGIIVPGFINAHCHLELSHLKNSIAKGTNLVSFLQKVMEPKVYDENSIINSIVLADTQMCENGIVAVGDISNTINSKKVKLKSNIHYHTFVEIVGFDPKQAADSILRGKELMENLLPLTTSLVPHAPYSVSKELFIKIKAYCENKEMLYSIHNQESEEESKFFQNKTGDFIDFYNRMNRNLDIFTPFGQNSIKTISAWLPKKQSILLVHNTYTKQEDVDFLKDHRLNITWCLCPNANLYIENRLPDISILERSGFPIVLGTDSLASNDHLCILSEIKTISKNFPSLTLDKLLKWATLNGATFLGKDKEIGSLEIGKKPGLNLISSIIDGKVTSESTVTKLI